MKNPTPKLPITPEERSNLRTFKIKLMDIAHIDATELSQCLQCSFQRAKYLIALAQFQMIPSIGPKVAQWVTELGYYSLEEIKNEGGADLIQRLEEHFGYWEDPCAEDALRCIVYHANHPGSDKTWFDFTSERKAYREKHGYPATRPTVPWYEKKKLHTEGWGTRVE
ncbi:MULTISPECIES: helix-hairpin-helix domain-containing protein [unclassified Paenibacillus]|uniref:helix-hairpin-helix domain-containing protein n=1 Tax=unclassified Paenibacillus TaxID=185978 RepID=UPI001AE53FF8|nr:MULTISPECIES: helix-hairpin-helix domain-containing protein [unclassified Paenibacillus]MBP1156450.1 hypothetical protein [Paenibacillus sp. PvP091]MBP1168164.1 hypothetical protein [Paenibacillus sp. PvR098]MBP2439192.1 hypothetical protein [Paenibacillus sp. PvP052]